MVFYMSDFTPEERAFTQQRGGHRKRELWGGGGELRWGTDSVGLWLSQNILRSLDPGLPQMLANHHAHASVVGSGDHSTPGVPVLTAYSKIKVKNLRTLWPVRELRFRPLDNFKMDLTGAAAFIAVLLRVRLDSLFTQLTALGLCSAWLLGTNFSRILSIVTLK